MLSPPDEPAVMAASLATVPGLGPVHLRELLDRMDPASAWRTNASRATAPEVVRAALADAGVGVTHRAAPDYPVALADDPEAPAVLFHRGDLAHVDRCHRVGIIGTRRCSHYGREVARQLGRDLTAAGIAVVSGLAAGIDSAAHEGALSAAGATPAIAVVGSGLDVVYPRTSASLWERIPERGVLLSEAPLGARPEPWRFPARNRIIAALSEVVVVVESHAVGGSMHTVRAALDRGVTVMAVPGSVRSSASTGTNKLLADGLPPVLDAQDVLVALDLATAGGSAPLLHQPVGALDLEPDEAQVLDAVGWEPTPTEAVLVRTGLPAARAMVLLNRLERAGIVLDQGGWWERQ